MKFINQKTNKRKGLNFVLTLGPGGQKMPQNFFKVLERQNMQSQTIFELYTDDNKSKYSSNPKDILKSEKKKKEKEKLYTKRTSTAATNEFVQKIINKENI